MDLIPAPCVAKNWASGTGGLMSKKCHSIQGNYLCVSTRAQATHLCTSLRTASLYRERHIAYSQGEAYLPTIIHNGMLPGGPRSRWALFQGLLEHLPIGGHTLNMAAKPTAQQYEQTSIMYRIGLWKKLP